MKNKIHAWDIFWMSKIIQEEQSSWRRKFLIECLNCWGTAIKSLDDLKKSSRPRTCWKCKYRKDKKIYKEWDEIKWYIYLWEETINWIRMVKVKSKLDWRIVITSLQWWEDNRLKKEFDTRVRHWLHNDRFYKIYRWILDRCNSPRVNHYDRYWWRWIKCLWKTFEEFKNDMYVSYLEAYAFDKAISIDRIDSDWNYCKENCRWATKIEQANNTSSNIKIPDKYGWKFLSDILKERWVKRWTFYSRIKSWWTFDEAIWL